MEERGINKFKLLITDTYKWRAVLTRTVRTGSVKFADFLTSWETRRPLHENRQTDSQYKFQALCE